MSKLPTILSVRNFDVNKLSFEKGKAIENRAPSINLKYDNDIFNIRLPAKMATRLWVNTDKKDPSKITYTLTSNLKDCDPYGKERSDGTSDYELLYNLLAFDLKEKIISTAEENSKSWFGKQKSRTTLEENFANMCKFSEDKETKELNGKFPPSIRVKLPVYFDKKLNKNIVGCKVIDENKNDVYLPVERIQEVFQNGMEISMVVSPSVYVITGAGFGVTFKLTMAQIFSKPNLNIADVFRDEEEQVSNETPKQTQPENEEYEEPPNEEFTNVEPVKETTTTAAPARKKRTAAH